MHVIESRRSVGSNYRLGGGGGGGTYTFFWGGTHNFFFNFFFFFFWGGGAYLCKLLGGTAPPPRAPPPIPTALVTKYTRVFGFTIDLVLSVVDIGHSFNPKIYRKNTF